jgi:hypothetical protein
LLLPTTSVKEESFGKVDMTENKRSWFYLNAYVAGIFAIGAILLSIIAGKKFLVLLLALIPPLASSALRKGTSTGGCAMAQIRWNWR